MGKHHDGSSPAQSAALRHAEGVVNDLKAKIAQRQAEGASPMEMGVLQRALRMAVQNADRIRAGQGASPS